MPVLAESKLGFIVTNGDPTGASSNTVTCGDFQFLKSNLFGDKIVHGDAYYERSFSGSAGQDDSFALHLDFPNEPWNGYFRFKQVGENFAPALGFVSRPGIRGYSGNVGYRQRLDDSVLRWWEITPEFGVTTGLNNEVQSRTVGSSADISTNAGDYFLLEFWSDYENVPTPFALPHKIIVPAGEYSFEVAHFHTDTASSRMLSASFDVQCCGFYGGRLLQTDTTVTVHPSESLAFSAHHVMQQIHMLAGNVAIHVGSLDLSVNFTPDMMLRGQMQYDNISKNMELSLRYSWEFAPGSELLVVLGDDATLSGSYYQSHVSQFSVRLGKTFRL